MRCNNVAAITQASNASPSTTPMAMPATSLEFRPTLDDNGAFRLTLVLQFVVMLDDYHLPCGELLSRMIRIWWALACFCSRHVAWLNRQGAFDGHRGQTPVRPGGRLGGECTLRLKKISGKINASWANEIRSSWKQGVQTVLLVSTRTEPLSGDA